MLREGYSHDRLATVPPGCADVVADFLLRSHRGPDYLFASAAAVLLRSLGYPTRVVSGLYAAPWRYDPLTRHTPVTEEDVHFWAEVRLPDGNWITVEPTPGYSLLPPVRTWSDLIAQTITGAARWARANAGGLFVLFAAVVVAVRRRHDMLDRFATIVFGFMPPDDPRRFATRALSLIERRAYWAGRKRPPGVTPRRWYPRVVGEVPIGERAALEGLIRLADWAVHAPSGQQLSEVPGGNDFQKACRQAVKTWTLTRFRGVSSNQPRKAATA